MKDREGVGTNAKLAMYARVLDGCRTKSRHVTYQRQTKKQPPKLYSQDGKLASNVFTA